LTLRSDIYARPNPQDDVTHTRVFDRRAFHPVVGDEWFPCRDAPRAGDSTNPARGAPRPREKRTSFFFSSRLSRDRVPARVARSRGRPRTTSTARSRSARALSDAEIGARVRPRVPARDRRGGGRLHGARRQIQRDDRSIVRPFVRSSGRTRTTTRERTRSSEDVSPARPAWTARDGHARVCGDLVVSRINL